VAADKGQLNTEGEVCMEHLADLIKLSSGFKTAVNLQDDLDDLEKAAGFIPTRRAAEIIFDLGRNAHPTARQRSRLVMGTYGTGKSHLALVLANIYRGNTGSLQPVIEKLRYKWPGETETLEREVEHVREPFLLVLLEGHEGRFNDALLRGLREALQREGDLADLMPETSFTAALRRIDELEAHFPDAYAKLEEAAGASDLVSVDALRSRLERYDRGAYEEFCELHQQACAGAAFAPDSVMDPEDVYPVVAKQIRERGYGGTVVFWDEFGHYMESMVRNPTGTEAQEIQRFAELCNLGGKPQLHFYLICHRSLQEYVELVRLQGAARVSETLSDDLRKVSGRFSPFDMRTSDEETFELIDQVIIQDNEDGRWASYAERFRDQFDEWTDTAVNLGLFPEFDRQQVHSTVTLGSYPLHPMSAHCLPLLSQRVAQNERTLFHFLAATEPRSLGEFVDRTEVDDGQEFPPVAPIDLLWDYFEDAIEDEPRTKMTHREFSQTDSKVGSDDELGKRVLRAVGVITVIESDRITGATEEVLAYGLGLRGSGRDELSKCLARLSASDAQILVKQQSDGAYRFYRGGVVDVAQRLAETVEERKDHLNWIDYINKHLWEELRLETVIPATGYNDERFITRQLSVEAAAIDALDNPRPWTRRLEEDESLDGFALVLLPRDSDELSEAQEKARQFGDNDDERTARDRFVMAVPEEPVRIEQLVREHDALRTLRVSQPAIYGEGGEQEDEWDARYEDLTETLREEFQTIMNPDTQGLRWYWRGEEQTNVRSRGTLRRLASDVMGAVFPLTPAIRHDRLTQRTGSDTFRKYRQPVIDMIFSADGPMLLKRETDEAQKHVIAATLELTGVLREEGGEWIVGRPDEDSQPEVAAVWDVVAGFIDQARESGDPQPVKPLVETLIGPPYGVPRRALSLFVAAVMADDARRGNIMLDHQRTKYNKERIREPSGEDVDVMVHEPERYQLLYVEVSDTQRAILSGVAAAFDVPLAETDEVSHFITAVADGLRDWWYAQPEYAKMTLKLSEDAQQVRREVFVPLSMPDADAEDILLRALPDMFDLEEANPEEIRGRVREVLEGLREQIEAAVGRLKRDIAKTVTEVFAGTEAEDVSAPQALRSWYAQLPDHQQKHVFPGDAGPLMRIAPEASPRDLDAIPGQLIGTDPEGWNDSTLAQFRGHLESAKRAVEAFQELRPPSQRGQLPHVPLGYVAVSITDANGVFEKTFSSVDEISDNGQSMANIIRSAVDGIGRTLRDGECQTILVQLLKEALDGPSASGG